MPRESTPEPISLDAIMAQIIAALSHVEAEDGLYLDNLQHLHEEDERQKVEGSQLQVLDALKILISEGKVIADDSADDVIFRIAY